jgi:hypothetical protein
MYLMYVDESGDTGMSEGSSPYFCLSGLVIHESKWREFIDYLINHRRVLNSVYNLPMRAEIHSSEYIRKNIYNIEKYNRLSILRNTIDEISKIDYISITSVVIQKQGKPHDLDVLNIAWGTLFQRFENTLKHGNFPGSYSKSSGIIITDAVAGNGLIRLMRKMSRHNYIPSSIGSAPRNLPITRIIEDPSGRDSKVSLPIQICDVIAYFLMQKFSANSYIKRKSATNYYDRLLPILNTKASRSNKFGIVIL